MRDCVYDEGMSMADYEESYGVVNAAATPVDRGQFTTWTTITGKRLLVSEMSDDHLTNAYLMILRGASAARVFWLEALGREITRRGRRVWAMAKTKALRRHDDNMSEYTKILQYLESLSNEGANVKSTTITSLSSLFQEQQPEDRTIRTGLVVMDKREGCTYVLLVAHGVVVRFHVDKTDDERATIRFESSFTMAAYNNTLPSWYEVVGYWDGFLKPLCINED